MRNTLLIAGALLVVSCRGPGSACCPPSGAERAQPPAATQRKEAVVGIPDTRIGLDQHAASDTPTPVAFHFVSDDPTPGKTLARPYATMPPPIPHDIADMLPITREENICLDCHDPSNAEREEGDGKPIPASHFIDYRRAPDRQGIHIAGARYNCTACHVRSSDAKPLVVNRFRR